MTKHMTGDCLRVLKDLIGACLGIDHCIQRRAAFEALEAQANRFGHLVAEFVETAPSDEYVMKVFLEVLAAHIQDIVASSRSNPDQAALLLDPVMAIRLELSSRYGLPLTRDG